MLSFFLRTLQAVIQFVRDLGHPIAVRVAATIAVAALALPIRWWSNKRKFRMVARELAGKYAEYYDPGIVRTLTKWYVEPDGQTTDPADEGKGRMDGPDRSPLFGRIEDLLADDSEKYCLVLADTAMGKTSLLVNFFARTWRKWKRNDLKIALVPLCTESADSDIERLEDKARTVLLLDALDEDPRAIGDPLKRLFALFKLTQKFYRTVITCRTQFFDSDDQIPTAIPPELNIFRVADVENGRTVGIRRIYLSPFDEKQVTQFLHKRFPRRLITLWHAKKLCAKLPDLYANPMVLSHIDDLMPLETCNSTAEAFKRIVDRWLKREEGFADPVSLRTFSQLAAVEMIKKGAVGQEPRLNISELKPIADLAGANLDERQESRNRSLLSRDALERLRFAHRSIMEYLFVERFHSFPRESPSVQWTPTMKRFYCERLFDEWRAGKTPIEGYENADLGNLEQLGLRPIDKLRSRPKKMSEMEANFTQLRTELRDGTQKLPHLYRLVSVEPAISAGIDTTELRQDLKTFVSQPDTHKIAEAVLGDLRERRRFIVMDHALGLAWELQTGGQSVPYEGAEAKAFLLSQLKFGGLAPWRVPTLQEMRSLIHLLREPECDSVRLTHEAKVWTCDRKEEQHISVSPSSLDLYTVVGGPRPHAICVSSLPTRFWVDQETLKEEVAENTGNKVSYVLVKAPETVRERLPVSILPPNNIQPHPRYMAPPIYSVEAPRRALHGEVVISMTVGTEGEVLDPKVAKSSEARLDKEAIACVSKWRFQPAVKDGKPVPVRISAVVSFEVDSTSARIVA